jgi:hypothetical protein
VRPRGQRRHGASGRGLGRNTGIDLSHPTLLFNNLRLHIFFLSLSRTVARRVSACTFLSDPIPIEPSCDHHNPTHRKHMLLRFCTLHRLATSRRRRLRLRPVHRARRRRRPQRCVYLSFALSQCAARGTSRHGRSHAAHVTPVIPHNITICSHASAHCTDSHERRKRSNYAYISNLRANWAGAGRDRAGEGGRGRL